MTHPCPMCGGSGTLDLFALANYISDKPGAVGHNHPDTSTKAARQPSNRPRFGSQRWHALRLLADHGPMTAAEVATHLGISRNQAATRLGECRQIGLAAWARDTTNTIITRPTGPNDQGRVQRITDAGLAALNHQPATH